MVNWQDPESLALQYQILVKFVHFTDGVYIWEWLSNIGYEWKILSGKKKFRWSMAIYVLCRFTTLATVVCDLVFFNITTEFNCQAAIRALLVTGYTSLMASPFLIMIRTIAIWNRNLFISVIVIGLYLVNVSFLIWGLVEGPISTWDPVDKLCAETRTSQNKLNIMVSFGSDVSSLAIALLGLWLRRSPGNFWRMVYRQGLIWIAVAILFYGPPSVFLWLNLSAPMNLMFENPACIAMGICATRMYRILSEYDDSDISITRVSHTLKFAPNANLRSNISDFTDPTVSIPLTSVTGRMEQWDKSLDGGHKIAVDGIPEEPK